MSCSSIFTKKAGSSGRPRPNKQQRTARKRPRDIFGSLISIPVEKQPLLSLSQVQKVDLKKIFQKMQAQEYCKFHRSSKWIHQFLDENMNNILIYTGRRLEIYATRIDPPNSSRLTCMIIKNNVNLGEKSGTFAFYFTESNENEIKEMFSRTNSSFLLDNLVIKGGVNAGSQRRIEDAHYISFEKLITLLAECQVKSKCCALHGMKPVEAIFAKLKPSRFSVTNGQLFERTAGAVAVQGPGGSFWSHVQERRLTVKHLNLSDFQGIIFNKVLKRFEGRLVSLDFSGTDHSSHGFTAVPSLKRLVQQCRRDTILKRLCAEVTFRNDSINFEAVFPQGYTTIVYSARSLAVEARSRCFVFPGTKYTALLHVAWYPTTIQNETTYLLKVRCEKCTNSTEARSFLRYFEDHLLKEEIIRTYF